MTFLSKIENQRLKKEVQVVSHLVLISSMAASAKEKHAGKSLSI